MNGAVYEELLEAARVTLVQLFHRLEAPLPKPRFVERGGNPMFRYDSPTVELAIILKFARMVSALHGLLATRRFGLTLEVGTMVRIIMEMSEDIKFLALLKARGDGTFGDAREPEGNHKRFLDEFWQEEFDDPESPLNSTQSRNRVPRDKVRSAIARFPGYPKDWQGTGQLHRTVGATLGGYVHGASVHVLDLYGGSSPEDARFGVSGIRAEVKAEEMLEQAVVCMNSCILAAEFIAQVFGDRELAREIRAFQEDFQRRMEQDSSH